MEIYLNKACNKELLPKFYEGYGLMGEQLCIPTCPSTTNDSHLGYVSIAVTLSVIQSRLTFSPDLTSKFTFFKTNGSP